MDKELKKSIDAKIDELFATEAEPVEAPESSGESVEKAAPVYEGGKKSSLMKDGSDAGPGKQTADEGEKPKKAKQEKEGENGRPKEVQDVPNSDEDGSRAKGYDHIQKEQKKTPEISANGAMVKSETEAKAEDKVEVSKEDYEILQKAKADSIKAIKDEELKKVEEKQSDLIKSAVAEATKASQAENEELRKSLQETQELVKAIASKPQRRKSVDNIHAMEKSFGGAEQEELQKAKANEFTMEDMQDAADELVKSQTPGFNIEHAIELDDSGSIQDPQARKLLEKQLRKK